MLPSGTRIAERHTDWEIVGPPEIRDVDPNARYFSPWKVIPQAELIRISETGHRAWSAYCATLYRYSRPQPALSTSTPKRTYTDGTKLPASVDV